MVIAQSYEKLSANKGKVICENKTNYPIKAEILMLLMLISNSTLQIGFW